MNCGFGKKIIYSTKVLESNLCDYNDTHIKGNITIIGCDLTIKVTFKKCVPFIKCIIKIDGTAIDYAKIWIWLC